MLFELSNSLLVASRLDAWDLGRRGAFPAGRTPMPNGGRADTNEAFQAPKLHSNLAAASIGKGGQK